MIETRPPPSVVAAALGLVAIAAAIAGLRLLGDAPGTAGTTAWAVNLDVALEVRKPGFSAQVYLPRDRPGVLLYGQAFEHPGIALARPRGRGSDRALVIRAAPGAHRFRADLRVLVRGSDPDAHAVALTDSARSRYLAVDLTAPDTARYRFLFGQGRSSGRDGHAVVADARRAIRRVHGWDKLEGAADAVAAFVWFCRARGVPARMVTGVVLGRAAAAADGAGFARWAEVYVDGAWRIEDPLAAGDAPSVRRLAFRYEASEAIEANGDGTLRSEVRVTPLALPGWAHDGPPRWRDALDFSRLPVEQQETLGLLLVLPLGLLITVVARRFLGVSVFGTFGPTLLALGVTSSSPATFALVTAVVVLLSLAGRFALTPLGLARVPRMAAVFTFVAASLAFAVSALSELAVETDDVGLLLPLVVLTVLVDQFTRAIQDTGMRAAVARMLRTLAVTGVVVLVFHVPGVAATLVRLPELNLLTVAAIIVLGSARLRTGAPGEGPAPGSPAGFSESPPG